MDKLWYLIRWKLLVPVVSRIRIWKRKYFKSRVVVIREKSTQLEKEGHLRLAKEKLLELKPTASHSDKSKLDFLRWQLMLLDEGFPFPEAPVSPVIRRPRLNSVVFLLYNSLPYASAGYATRSQSMAKSLLAKQWRVSCATRYGFPIDVNLHDGGDVRKAERVDGVEYLRALPEKGSFTRIGSEEYFRRNIQAVTQVLEQKNPAIVHASSNHINGIAACIAGEKLGLPVIYEVRGLWDITRGSAIPNYMNSDKYQQSMRMELDVCHRANHVCTITVALKDFLIDQGINEQKITVLPNGVDLEKFKVREPDPELMMSLGLTGKVVIGYVGSMQQYEGLDLLLQAISLVREKTRVDFHFLAVGDGSEIDTLKKMAIDLNINDIVTFAGRVPHNDVADYYSLIHVCPFPRKDQLVCQLVSPLKPFEAMAMGKAVVSSDVAALRESIEPGVNGLLHKADDVDSLCFELLRLIDNPELAKTLGDGGRAWVKQHRSWETLTEKLIAVYDHVSLPEYRSGGATHA